MRAAIYVRVSTEQQEEHGFSLQSQVEACRVYCEQRAMEVVGEFSDSVSGALLARPGLDALLDLVERHGVDAVVIFAADRLSRKLSHNLILRETFQKADVELHIASRGKADDTAESRLLQNMEGVIAEFEREKIKERTRRGRLQKARNGKWQGQSWPYGYRKIGRRGGSQLVVNPVEADVVRRVFDLYIEGKNRFAIAKLLTAQGIATSGHGKKTTRTSWTDQAVRLILMNRSYLGEFSYAGEVVLLPELAIISHETFEAARQRLERNKALAQPHRKFEYMLSGFLTCSCGRPMNGRSTKTTAGAKSYLYYKCSQRQRCLERNLRVDLVDNLCWDWITNLLGDPENLRLGVERMRQKQADTLRTRRARLGIIDGLVSDIDAQLGRLSKGIATANNETVADVLLSQMKQLATQRDELMHERESLAGQAEQANVSFDELLTIAGELRDAIVGADYETRRWLLDKLGFTAELEHDADGRRLNVRCIIATEGANLCIEANRV